MIFLFWVLEWPFYILGINPHKKGSAPVGLAIGGLWGHTLCVACQLPISKGGGESKAESRSSGDSSQWSEKLCKTYAVCKTPVFFFGKIRHTYTYPFIHWVWYGLMIIFPWFMMGFPRWSEQYFIQWRHLGLLQLLCGFDNWRWHQGTLLVHPIMSYMAVSKNGVYHWTNNLL